MALIIDLNRIKLEKSIEEITGNETEKEEKTFSRQFQHKKVLKRENAYNSIPS